MASTKDNGASMERWDPNAQEAHGGQDIHLANFVEDFSVTCNALGTPAGALKAAQEALTTMEHYPAADQEPALGDLARFIAGDNEALATDIHSRLILGNGASELIDLVDRTSSPGPWKPGNTVVQYKEYERSARAQKRTILSYESPEKAALTCLVNPTNPTGDWKDLKTMQEYIRNNVTDGTTILVDESMIFWHSPEWRAQSLMCAPDFAKELAETRNITLYVMVSWTKIWACPGLRVGSVLCPTPEHKANIKKVMVPWSVNCAALKFVSTVVKDTAYLDETWRETTRWNKRFRAEVNALFPDWVVMGEEWMSWVWVKLPSEDLAIKLITACRNNGCPIRWGKPGYEMPDHVRFGIRPDAKADVMLKILAELKASC